MQWHEGLPPAQWDNTLAARDGHFLQSSHWAAFQQALGRRVFWAQTKDWQCLAILETAKTGARLYAPYGPAVTHTKGFQQACAALQELGAQTDAVFARLEPTGIKKIPATQGLLPAFKPIQPTTTWVLDLTLSTDDLLAGMTPTNRNLYRTYNNKGLTLRTSYAPKDMAYLIELMRQVAAHNKIVQHSDHYYQTMAEVLLPRNAASLYITEHNGTPVATAFCFDGPATRYYAHAAADFASRKLHPGTPLLAKMIFDAKTAGKRQFDFVGVAPADAPATHRWHGLSKFKQSFGGEYKEYAGTWELPIKQFGYKLYRTAYGVKRKLKR